MFVTAVKEMGLFLYGKIILVFLASANRFVLLINTKNMIHFMNESYFLQIIIYLHLMLLHKYVSWNECPDLLDITKDKHFINVSEVVSIDSVKVTNLLLFGNL